MSQPPVRAVNALTLSATVVVLHAMRYTPAGIPALDLVLEHESVVPTMGSMRQVKLQVKAVAFGSLAETLATQVLGSGGLFQGFLTPARAGSKGLLFHIQDFKKP